MKTESEIITDGINDFINSIIAARESGFIDSSTATIAEFHRVAQNHVFDKYGINLPGLVEQWGKEVAKLCGRKD